MAHSFSCNDQILGLFALFIRCNEATMASRVGYHLLMLAVLSSETACLWYTVQDYFGHSSHPSALLLLRS